MKPVRLAAGGLVWLVAGLLGVVGLLLSLTIVLLPVGVPVLMLARRLFSLSARLVLPRSVTHPVQEMRKRAGDAANRALERGGDVLPARGRYGRAARRRRMRKKIRRARRRLKLS